MVYHLSLLFLINYYSFNTLTRWECMRKRLTKAVLKFFFSEFGCDKQISESRKHKQPTRVTCLSRPIVHKAWNNKSMISLQMSREIGCNMYKIRLDLVGKQKISDKYSGAPVRATISFFNFANFVQNLQGRLKYVFQGDKVGLCLHVNIWSLTFLASFNFISPLSWNKIGYKVDVFKPDKNAKVHYSSTRSSCLFVGILFQLSFDGLKLVFRTPTRFLSCWEISLLQLEGETWCVHIQSKIWISILRQVVKKGKMKF